MSSAAVFLFIVCFAQLLECTVIPGQSDNPVVPERINSNAAKANHDIPADHDDGELHGEGDEHDHDAETHGEEGSVRDHDAEHGEGDEHDHDAGNEDGDEHDHEAEHEEEDGHDHDAEHGEGDQHEHDHEQGERDDDHDDEHEEEGDEHDHDAEHAEGEEHEHDDEHGEGDEHDHGDEHGEGDEHDHDDEHGEGDEHDHDDEHGEGDEHDHEEGGEHDHEDHDAFTELLEQLRISRMDKTALSLLVDTLNEKTKCVFNAGECTECLDGEKLLQAANLDAESTLNENQFEEVAAILVYILHAGMNTSCDGAEAIVSAEEAKNYLYPGGVITEAQFMLITQKISQQPCERASQCVAYIHNLFFEGGDESSGSGLLTELLLSVVECKCSLPEAEEFLDNLFDMFGSVDEVLPVAGFEDLLSQLKIGNVEAHDSEDQHNHRKKRAIEEDEHDHDHANLNGSCYDSDELLEIYRISETSGINKTQLTQLCPALIQQIISGSCAVTKESHPTENSNYADHQKYGYGTAAVLIISMLAFLGLLVFPAIGTSGYKLTMQFFIALGVGTMSGDALLHIIPEVVGLHQHGDGEAHDHEEEEDRTYLWRLVVVVGGIYLFYLFENSIRLWNRLRKSNVRIHLHNHGSGEHDHQHTAIGSVVIPNENNGNNNAPEKFDAELNKFVCGKMNAVAIMVFIGDVLHNFGDGIAIGVSFSTSWVTGVSTSIAVFCHELPHEFGDFAIYLNNGMPKWRALLANFGAACTSFVGLYLGIGIAEDPNVRHWMLSLIAGMFLYISLVDVLHEMLEQKTEAPVLQFVLQNFGLVLGWAILLVIALYEESISDGIK